MIAADSNLIVRHLTQDDAKQAEKARTLFEQAELSEEPVFLGHVVLCEICWVLRAVYGFQKTQITTAIQALLDDGTFELQERARVEAALALYKKHAGQFPDHLIGVVAQGEGASTTSTFDKDVGKLPNFTLL